MRKIKTLLKLLLEKIEKDGVEDSGLCWASECMFDGSMITDHENDSLYDYINENKPYNHIDDWGWPSGLLEPRIEWLKKEIKKIS